MECERCTAMRRRTKRDATSLCLHDAFDEVESQTVTWHVRSYIPSSIERFEQVTLIRIVNTSSMVRHPQLNFVRLVVFLRGDFNLNLATPFSVLERIAEKILNA